MRTIIRGFIFRDYQKKDYQNRKVDYLRIFIEGLLGPPNMKFLKVFFFERAIRFVKIFFRRLSKTGFFNNSLRAIKVKQVRKDVNNLEESYNI